MSVSGGTDSVKLKPAATKAGSKIEVINLISPQTCLTMICTMGADGDYTVSLKEEHRQTDIIVKVTATDGLSTMVYTVRITRGIYNQDPVAIGPSFPSVAENQAPGTVVATLTATDYDIGESFTLSLVEGSGSTDNAFFEIVGDQLRTLQSFDYESKSSYNVRIRVSDRFVFTFEQAFTILIYNLPDPV
ncbi:cadherin repeat domain-containing protein [Cohnella soli]|uniref:Cadherin repeat domain-containing protein n=1 Tax=Cohnella soli TaxID=425005 RepID=A0ABW0HWU8_9BACL